MTLLAVDCATNACSAALWLDGGPGPRRYRPMRRGHAEALMPMVGAVMDEAGLSFSDLDAIAVTTGPGAFTGIRIGLAAARGFALAAGLPLIGVTTLEAVASAHDGGGAHLLVALDSKRDDIYVQLFGPDGAPLTDPASAVPEAAARLVPEGPAVALAGDAADRMAAALAGREPAPRRLGGPGLPDAAVVARLAARRFAAAPPGPRKAPPSALYLRPPDAVPAAQRRVTQGR
ncbi:MAG: tRNA (adenosine(37)-N6)-threonylcarbamoyltransferase complex dimerization subunit type 1 TsaB [Alphaproteobacteria bacterium]|nr:tRNA (adenosine(37)-N6)-threonylcarbamoyltransferase complex dimerization subunit type 1 TsaB [Alphaproteobacteria bacterium]